MLGRSAVSNFSSWWSVATRILCPGLGQPNQGFSRQEYWSGLPFPFPGDHPGPGIKPRSLSLQADSVPSEPPGKPFKSKVNTKLSKTKEEMGPNFRPGLLRFGKASKIIRNRCVLTTCIIAYEQSVHPECVLTTYIVFPIPRIQIMSKTCELSAGVEFASR